MPRPQVSRPVRTRPLMTTNPNSTSAPALESKSDGVENAKAHVPGSDIHGVSDHAKERAATRRKSLRHSASARNIAVSAETIQQSKALERAEERRDAAMERLQNITSTDTTGNSDGEEEEEPALGAHDSPSPSQVVKATPPRGRPSGRSTDLSGLDLDDSMFDDLNTTIDTAVHASAHRSAETSMLSVSQFRRRPRAGSFLSRDDGPIRPSSRAGSNTPAFASTLNFGVFKRRAREPSILSTTRKPRSERPGLDPEQEPEDDDDDDMDDDDDKENVQDNNEEAQQDDNGFAPEAESTPLRRSKRVSRAAETPQPTSSTHSRKRKSTGDHTRRLRSSPFEVRDGMRQSIEQPASDDESPLSSPPMLPQHAPSTPIAPSMDPKLMAPPLSSDASESEEEDWPTLKSIPKARTRQAASALRQTPGAGDEASDMSSPPSLTHSPNYVHSSSPPPARAAKSKRSKTAPKQPRKVTTADLTGLLPRRRQRVAGREALGTGEDDSEEEVDISGLREGDDELGHLDVRTRRHPAPRASARNHATVKSKPSARNNDKTIQGPNKRISRTYGRLSDKETLDQNEDENEDEDDANNDGNSATDLGEEDSQMLVERMGEELKNAVRKFQDVDQWELSFEENARSSSPVDAR